MQWKTCSAPYCLEFSSSQLSASVFADSLLSWYVLLTPIFLILFLPVFFFYFFLCLYPILPCLHLFIPRLLSLCLSSLFVSFIFHSFFLSQSHISSLTSFLFRVTWLHYSYTESLSSHLPFSINADNSPIIKWYGILDRLQFYVYL